MKQSTRTAESIYIEIKSLEEEVRDLDKALEEVEHIPTAAKILNRTYEEKSRELQRLKDTRFIGYGPGRDHSFEHMEM